MDAAGTVSLRGVDGAAGPRAGPTPPTVDDVALVLHTSGSTGRPKRVPLKHANLSISAQNVAHSYALDARRRLAVRDAAVPRARPRGVDAGDARDRRHGRRAGEVQPAVVLADRARSRRHLVFGGADAASAAAGARGDPSDPSRRPAGTEKLRFIRSCSASLPPQVMHDARSGVRRAGARGLRHDRGGAPDGVEPAAAVATRKPARSGAAPTSGSASWTRPARTCRSARRGEVVIQGPNVITGYENNPEANATSFVDGWFRTGDQGVLDENGYLTLVARIKELINRGGEKISPREIDEVLLDASGRSPRRCASACRTAPGARRSRPRSCCAKASRSATPICWRSARSGWPTSSGRSRFTSPQAIPRTATGKIQRGVVAKAYSA